MVRDDVALFFPKRLFILGNASNAHLLNKPTEIVIQWASSICFWYLEAIGTHIYINIFRIPKFTYP